MSNRGFGRGRRGGTGFRVTFNNRQQGSRDNIGLPPDRDLKVGLRKESLSKLEKPSALLSDPAIKLEKVEYISSYNWVEDKSPTIIVPGSPRVWLDKPMPFSVNADTDICFVDQNGHRMPEAPLLPLIVAVNKRYDEAPEGLEPAFAWPAIDIVTDRNNLRKLMRWINRPNKVEAAAEIRDFRIDLQLAGSKTVLMNRWEKRTRESAGFGFGFNFEKTSSKPGPGCEASTGHHRIIGYDMNGMSIVIRFEVDACMAAPKPVLSKVPPPSKQMVKPTIDDLADQLAGVSIKANAFGESGAASSSAPRLTVRTGGSWSVEQSSIIELTTRSSRNAPDFNWTEAFPQLFVSQTQHHFLAVHDRGRFSRVQREQLDSEKMKAIEAREQSAFKRLRTVLEMIQKLVIKHGDTGRLSLVCEKGELRVYERESLGSSLPDEVMRLFSA